MDDLIDRSVYRSHFFKVTFEMSRSSFLMSFWKINLSLIFNPYVIRGPCLYETYKVQLIKSIIQVKKLPEHRIELEKVDGKKYSSAFLQKA